MILTKNVIIYEKGDFSHFQNCPALKRIIYKYYKFSWYMYLVFSKSVIAYYIYMIIFLFRTLIEFS